MPRIPTKLLRHARALNPLLTLLLRPCRDLDAARNELRWLRERAIQDAADSRTRNTGWRTSLKRMVEDRASGKPLQYILGTEYFGDLEIHCRPGVLIPRQETAASTSHLVDLISRAKRLPPELRVLDLCTGTGCIPLLFQRQFSQTRSDEVSHRLLGIDISDRAVKLAQYNLADLSDHEHPGLGRRTKSRNRRKPSKWSILKPRLEGTKHSISKSTHPIQFLRADVLVDPFNAKTLTPPSLMAALNFARQPPFWDILISNPPYISPSAFATTTTRSVRNFEPKLALVPPPPPEPPQPRASWPQEPDVIEPYHDPKWVTVRKMKQRFKYPINTKSFGRGSSEGSVLPPAIAYTAVPKLIEEEIREGDEFYPRLLAEARRMEAKIVLLEVADVEQALRVARMARGMGYLAGVEIWRDRPDCRSPADAEVIQDGFRIIGEGNGRSVLCWTERGAEWLGKV